MQSLSPQYSHTTRGRDAEAYGAVHVAQGEEPRPPKEPEPEHGQEESVLVDDEGWGVVNDSEVREFIELEHPAAATAEATAEEAEDETDER